ncbi:MAG: radical SAM family heme chaperone HemW [Thermoanaerobaculia bacterium]
MNDALGLYLHVPFCRTRCRYCDFYRVGEKRERMDRFVVALGREIDGWSGLHGRRVDSIFFGGGTPSLLEPDEIARLIERLALRFALTEDCEVSVEANPSDASLARFAGLRAAGVNRLSLGVQSFVDRELGLLGRRHDAAGAARALAEARAAGFANLALDLMVGVPAQTDGSFAASLARAVELAPDHLSVYLLEVHPGSEIDGLRRERPRLFAGEEAMRRRYLALAARLAAAGFRQYEISNFARPGHECRHNLKYWRCEPFLGLGPSAHSAVDGRRFRHPADLERWLADPLAIEPVDSDPGEERLFLGLRLAEGIPLAWLRAHGPGAAEIDRRLARLASWIESDGERVRLTREGFVISNAVLTELLA